MAPKNLRRRIVRLEVPFYVTFAVDGKGTYFDSQYQELQRKVFDPANHPDVMFVSKDGWYLDRKANFAWVYYQGVHYTEDAGMHRYNLGLQRAPSFSLHEEAAIRSMLKVKLPIPKRLSLDWVAYQENRELQSMTRATRLWGLKFKKNNGIQ